MSHWNYRVIEFVVPGESRMRAIHEVHYTDDGQPSMYSETPAAVCWDTDDGAEGAVAVAILDRMREALSKPVLSELDFHEAKP